MLVNNAGFSTTGPVYRSDREREMAMIRTDVEAVVDLCSIFLPGMVERRRGARAQRGLDRRLPTAPGPGRVRGVSKAFVLVLQPGRAGRAARDRRQPSPRCARAR